MTGARRRAVLLLAALVAGLVVAPRPAEAAPKPLEVSVASPGTLSPAVVPTGAPVVVRFSTNRNATWSIGYRRAGTTAPFAELPDARGTGQGSRVEGVSAPADAGTYDLAVTVRSGSSQAQAIAARSLIVTGPAALPSQRCDDLDATACLLPFPNDVFTGADPTTDTGRRVNLHIASTPRNVAGVPIDPTEWNRNDGFSPGSMVLTHVPGLDLHATWNSPLDHIQDLARFERPEAPMVLLDADTGQRHPFWSELDTHATNPDEQLLILRPATNLLEGHRYIVALRDLRRSDRSVIPAGPVFAGYRDRTSAPGVDAARRPHFERLFRELGTAGIDRSGLFLAWDFTVASERNLTERALHIRDDAFAGLGDTDLADRQVAGAAPGYAITKVTEQPDGDTLRRVEGTVFVPNYLASPQAMVDLPDPAGEPVAVPQSRFNTAGSPDGLPVVNPVQRWVHVDFVCNVPSSAAETPAHPTLYGHGLLGGRDEANGSSTTALRRHGFAPCAVDWWGMAFSDLPNVAIILADLSRFPSLADRAQQGFLNFLYLGRALAHPQGLGADAAFRGAGGRRLLAPGELFYDGNSQGGIMGGALVALAPDLTRAKLGVPGMNYSTLLNRSSDWEADAPLAERLPGLDPTDPTGTVAYADAYTTSYPSVVDQQLGYALLQMLWDRAEANGYAHHMTSDPLPGTPSHQVMLQVAFADHQVANVTAEVEARTIGAHLHVPAVADGLHWSADPGFGMPVWDTRTQGPLQDASVLMYWFSTDRGLTTPPNGNTPPRAGTDPHGDPRKDKAAATQVARFLLTGEVIDVCAQGPCVTDATRR